MNKNVLDYFGFSRMPFTKTASASKAFPTQSFQEAVARLEYGIKEEDVVLLTGSVGVGKSVVLHNLLQRMDGNSYTPIYIRGNGLGEGELYKGILAGLDREPPRYTQTAKRLFFSVVPQLTRKPIIVIDDAQEMKESALATLKAMTNFGCDSQSKLTFILSGQPELRARLKLSQFLSLAQRIRVFFHMKGMSLEETCRYIDHHTVIAGNHNSLFSDAAKAEIHRHSEGIPRVVNTVCYRSIINAVVKEVKVIDSADLFLEDLSGG